MINAPYTLFSRIPLYRAEDGTFYTDDLWEKDLSLHLNYISQFHICCPVLPWQAGQGTDTPILGLQINQVIPLRHDRGWGSVLANLLPNALSVFRAAKRGGILHSSGAGWAFPLSYYILLLRPFLSFRWLMVIESTFWMVPVGCRPSLRKGIAQQLHRTFIRYCLRSADARIFTQDWYRAELLGDSENCLIAPASWIDEEFIASAPPPKRPGPLRLIYPTRMVTEKGVDTVLAALAAYDQTPNAPPLVLDMIGQGPMAEQARAFAAQPTTSVTLRFLDPVPYGPPFFALLRGYDGVLIANLTEEQPRIAFDAFSQGLPCIASNTSGNASVIYNGETGHLFAPGDATDLTALLLRLAAAPDDLAALRRRVLTFAHAHTHRAMHRNREAFLKTSLGSNL